MNIVDHLYVGKVFLVLIRHHNMKLLGSRGTATLILYLGNRQR
jgi:hypothetical protein